MINGTTIEICLGNIQDVAKLNNYPVDRIELNSALELGGLTCSINTLIEAKKATNLPICCMVRTRGGDFCYSDEEYEVMYKDAKTLLENGADGIVFGFLTSEKKVDVERTRKMVEIIKSFGKEAVFHKAFDEIEDLDEASATLVECGIDRVLTSGKAIYPDILIGCQTINKLYKKYGDKLQYLPGGGVRINNIHDVITTSATGQVHMTSKKTYEGGYIGLDENQLTELLKNI